MSREWLALREPADAEARARDLVERLRKALPADGRRVVHDLGGGTGAMGRWLAPVLPGPQHWLIHDRDDDLLDVAAANPPAPADRGEVTVQTRHSDITELPPHELREADLITASALLDLLTEDELSDLVTVCIAPGCPILLTLSVTGRVTLAPVEPLDQRLATAFNAHQRRMTDRGRLLGPDAVAFAAEHFERLGAEVLIRPSPWRLGAAQAPLAIEWLAGWVAAACEQEVELAPDSGAYMHRRLAQAAAGGLDVTVGHADLLVLPR